MNKRLAIMNTELFEPSREEILADTVLVFQALAEGLQVAVAELLGAIEPISGEE